MFHLNNGIPFLLRARFTYLESLSYCSTVVVCFQGFFCVYLRHNFPEPSYSVPPSSPYLVLLFQSQLTELFLSKNVSTSILSASSSILHLSFSCFPPAFSSLFLLLLPLWHNACLVSRECGTIPYYQYSSHRLYFHSQSG